MKINTIRTRDVAASFLMTYARFCVWDNHDDMQDMERWEHTFDYLVGEKISVEDFIVKYMPEEIQRVKDVLLEEEGEEWEILDEKFILD
jgi:hypothetical protein